MSYRYQYWRPKTWRTCRLCGQRSSYASRGAEVGDTDLCQDCVDRAFGQRPWPKWAGGLALELQYEPAKRLN